MDMLVEYFLIYALMFRLAIIAAGIVAIVLGYRLFAHDVKDGGGTGTNVSAIAGPVKFTLNKARSGAAFALFGAFIIVAMLVQGTPELLMKNIPQLSGSPSEPTLQLKGNNDNEPSAALQRFEQAVNEGHQRELAGDTETAIELYGKALSESEIPLRKAAVVLNALAWIYREQHRIDEALALARVATEVDGNNPAYQDTLALILLERGEHKTAEQVAETAVRLDPTNQDHLATLQRIRAAPKNGQ